MYPKHTIIRNFLVFAALLALSACGGPKVTLESGGFRYEIAENGKNLRFVDKANDMDYLYTDSASYCAYARLNGKIVHATQVSLKDSLMHLQFGEEASAVLRIQGGEERIIFEVDTVTGAPDALTFLNVPLSLAGRPVEPFGVTALALNMLTHVRQLPALQTHAWATAYKHIGMKGAKAALVGVPSADMLPAIRKIITESSALPLSDAGGAWAQQQKIGYSSYLMNFGSLTQATVKDWVAMCRNLGFTQIDNHGGGFFNFGELKIDSVRFPGGWKDFAKVNEALHHEGISSIFHTYAFFIDKNAKYVTPVPSPHLGAFRSFTLARPISSADSVIEVKESTADVSTIIGFFVRNSVTLRIGEELVEFSGVTDRPPYRFTGCKRGILGTRAAAHESGGQAWHLKEMFSRFVPEPESPLFLDIAKRTAEITNECGFDGLYLDAMDGCDLLGGKENAWYNGTRFVAEIVRHLKPSVGMEMSTMFHNWWHYRSRWQAWDTPQRGFKRFVDVHLASIKSPNLFLGPQIKPNDFEHGVWQGDTAWVNKYAPMDNGALLLPLTLGWWGNIIGESPQTETTFPDDIEYLCSKMLGNNAGTAILSGFDPGTMKAMPLFARLAGIIREYEQLRLGGYFPDSVRAMLRQPGKDFHLVNEGNGSWNFKPRTYTKYKISGPDTASRKWTVNNPYAAQPLRLRIEALMATRPWSDTGNVVIADFGADHGFEPDTSARGVSGSLDLVQEGLPGFAFSGRFEASSKGHVPQRGAWVAMGKPYEPLLNIEKHKALGVWVKGDGNGELLNFRLESPKHISHGARGDHFVKVDFEGWKYFELVEIESSEFTNYLWPNSDFYVYDSYRHSVGFGQISKLQLWYNNLPEGKTASCLISPVKAMPLVAHTIRNPVLSVGGKRIVLPVAMQSGMFLELEPDGQCTVYDAKGVVQQEVKLTGLPVLQPGENAFVFECETEGAVSPRALISVVTEGAPVMKK